MGELPAAGDIFWVALATGSGHEQHGRRPVLVVTDSRLTAMGMCWVVPLSTTERNWPTHVRLEVNGRTTWAMCEQLRSISVERLGRKNGTISFQPLSAVRSILRSIIGH
ncbi:MAG: type II toxin-antitoxin system PemK/MazF family toxin [Propionibacteriaceae bacterium]|jgi:mRNA interferase MazF|nr:type II toxin-antitoxin system PemK/MazF family toxin [Propionibacteriaceae bacterium]